MSAVIEMLDQMSGSAAMPPQNKGNARQEAEPFLSRRAEDKSLFAAMQIAFASTGGILGGDAFSLLLRERSDQPISLLARWIVRRQVVSFESHGQRWLPMFQFEPDTLCVNVGTQRVIEELRVVFDDVELTEWFASPNVWLDGDCPAHAMAADSQRVFDTARADRFVASGH